MTIRVLACAVLICVGSDPGVAGQIRMTRTARLFGDVAARPPRPIPNPRHNQSDMATHPPLPRARPASAPQDPAAITTASAPSPAGSGATPPNHPTAAGFPPVVTLE